MRFSLFIPAFFAIAFSLPAKAASFDCTKARTADELAVCASRALSELDVEMSVRFDMLSGLVAMGTRGDIGDAQRAFLAARRRCGGKVSCLAPLYRQRITVLKRDYESLKRRGPF